MTLYTIEGDFFSKWHTTVEADTMTEAIRKVESDDCEWVSLIANATYEFINNKNYLTLESDENKND